MGSQIIVDRFTSDNETTVSVISLDGHFVCFGLEDGYKRKKVAGQTRIPAGKYNVSVRRFGGFHDRYAHRFNAFHKGMLQIDNVPGFTDILIHVGNSHRDTAGCLLVGSGCNTGSVPMALNNSVDAYEKLYKQCIELADAGELSITYADGDL